MAWTGTVPTFTAGSRLRASKLQTVTDLLTALTGPSDTWTPTLTNLAIGSGGSAGVSARYRRVGSWVYNGQISVVLGSSGASVSGPPRFSLPAVPASHYGLVFPIGLATYVDSNPGNRWEGLILHVGSGVGQFYYFTEAGGGSGTVITSSAPFTWASGDLLVGYNIQYEVAP